MNIPRLNLPEFELKFKKLNQELYIFDEVRKKYLKLTPEEWVRQHFVHYLIGHLQYPKSLVKIETGLAYNNLRKRTDIQVYNNRGIPEIIVECKSFEIKINPKTLLQISAYQFGLQCRFMVLTNGIQHFCFEHHHERGIIAIDQLPEYLPA